MSNDSATLKEQIRERYGAIAEKQSGPEVAEIEFYDTRPQAEAASCCGPAASTSSCCAPGEAGELDSTQLAGLLYDETDLTDLPETVTNVSLGCGNPTAIASLKAGETVLDLGSGGGIDCFIAAKVVGPTGHVIGVDMTDRMLALANQNKAKLGFTNVEFRKAIIEGDHAEFTNLVGTMVQETHR